MAVIKFLFIAAGTLVIAFVAFVFLIAHFTISSGLSESDVDRIKGEIRAEFEKKPGYKVNNIVLVRENANKASGFVDLNVRDAGQVNKTCTVTMSDAGKGYWHCQ